MEKELVELFEAAKRAADAAAAGGSPAEESRCLDALKKLKDFTVNYQILVSTQVGKRLKHLTKHPRKKIQVFAIDLIEMWKNIIIEETKSNKNGTMERKNSIKIESAASENNKSSSAKAGKAFGGETVKVGKTEDGLSPRSEKTTKAEAVTEEKKVANGYAVKPESNKPVDPMKVDAVEKQENRMKNPIMSAARPTASPKLTSIIKCNDQVRDKMRELLLEALCKVSNEAVGNIRDEVDASDPIRVAVTVESQLFESWGRSSGAHKNKYRSLLFNLEDQNNPDFRRRVLLGHVSPEEIVVMPPEDMASDQRKAENKQINEKALFECERGGAPKATTDQFKCGRCGQRKTTYHQMQTRSADEPMTTYVTCVNCNNHWKFC
ncbi:Transcription elongation factor TFIIS-like protein [Drosera capensis]